MSKDRWIDEGLTVLAEEGAPGLKIDRIAARLGLSKGSFFHHFEGASDYRKSLLNHWETSATVDLGNAPAQDILAALADRATALINIRLEAAVRAWSSQDSDAALAQERVDRARLAALESVWSKIIHDPTRARIAAMLPHLVLIGATVALPPISQEELEGVFGLLGELAPSVSANHED